MGRFLFQLIGTIIFICVLAFVVLYIASLFWGARKIPFINKTPSVKESTLQSSSSFSRNIDKSPNTTNSTQKKEENTINYPISVTQKGLGLSNEQIIISDLILDSKNQVNGLYGIKAEYDIKYINNKKRKLVAVIKFYLEDRTPLSSVNDDFSFNGNCAIITPLSDSDKHIKGFIPYVAIEKFNNTGINKLMNDLFGWSLKYDLSVFEYDNQTRTYAPIYTTGFKKIKVRLPSEYESQYKSYSRMDCN